MGMFPQHDNTVVWSIIRSVLVCGVSSKMKVTPNRLTVCGV